MINNATLNNNAGGFIGGGLTNNAGTTTNAGEINNGVIVNGGTLNSNTATSIIGGGLTNSATANVRNQVNGAITNNAGGTLNIVGATTGTGALTNRGTLAAGNNTFTGLTSVTNSGVITGSSGIRAATWNNTGTITGNTFGIDTNGATTITNNGTIGGGTGSINFTANGNTLNITPLSVFNGAVFFNNTTGNTLNFGAGSYTIPVNAYRIVGNAINVSAVQTVITTGLNGSGTGNIVVNGTTPAGTVNGTVNVINGTSLANTTASQAREYTQIVSEMIGDVLTLDNEIFDTPPAQCPPPAHGQQPRRTGQHRPHGRCQWRTGRWQCLGQAVSGRRPQQLHTARHRACVSMARAICTGPVPSVAIARPRPPMACPPSQPIIPASPWVMTAASTITVSVPMRAMAPRVSAIATIPAASREMSISAVSMPAARWAS